MQTGKSKTLDLYPSVTEKHLEDVQNALCPFSIELPFILKGKISSVCKDFVEHKKDRATTTWEDSVLNSLDFHFSDGNLKIIEANTNASGFLLSNILLDTTEDALSFEQSLFISFKKIFKSENLKHILITDADPENEKMFAEFLMFKDFFKRQGIEAKIIKTSKIQITNESLYIYNRDTDFYLEKNPALKALWTAKEVFLSTSPASYQNIADKKFDVKNSKALHETDLSALKSATLETFELTAENRNEIWIKRKKLFFKPPSSFGSKGVYAGKSISRKKFDTLENGYLAQELCLPGKVTHEETEWKYDIRAYFSENGIQKVVARVYQGQLTNFSTLGGGFALIKWVD